MKIMLFTTGWLLALFPTAAAGSTAAGKARTSGGPDLERQFASQWWQFASHWLHTTSATKATTVMVDPHTDRDLAAQELERGMKERAKKVQRRLAAAQRKAQALLQSAHTLATEAQSAQASGSCGGRKCTEDDAVRSAP